MAHDLLPIEDDVYEYFEDQSFTVFNRNRVSLTESDPLWCKLRHRYVGDVPKIVDETVETHGLLRRHLSLSRYKTLPQLGDAVRRKLAYRKNQPHGRYRWMAGECMRIYCNSINDVDIIMQDLALGIINENSFSEDRRSSVLNILRNANYDLTEKLRLLLLYIFYAKGITKSEFDDIIASCELPFEASVVTNILHLDVDIFRPGSCRAVDYIPRNDASTSTSSAQRSNWTPAIKNVMLSCIDGTLNDDKYPYLQTDESVKRREKTGYRCTEKSTADQMSSLIVFIAGGVTYSEMKCAYEVMSLHRGVEVYIGADSIITPKKFLDKLGELRSLITKYM